jgi:hypothetical protein
VLTIFDEGLGRILRHPARISSHCLVPCCFALVFGYAALLYFGPSYQPREDAERAIAYLKENMDVKDTLYVHASMNEQFKLYSRKWSIDDRLVFYGDAGWPCCPRRNSSEETFSSQTF